MDNAIIQALRRAKQAYMTNVGEPTAQLVGGGVRGYLGLDAPEYADSRGMEAYRNAQAIANTPVVGVPAMAARAGTRAAPAVAKALREHSKGFQEYNRALGPAGASQAIVWQGSPHKYDAEKLVRLPSGEQVYVGGKFNAIKEVPPGATVLQDFPLGRIRSEAIGTGEGAQAYGHGSYLAEARDVARSYQRNLASTLFVDGKPIFQNGRIVNSTGNEMVDDLLLMHSGDTKSASRDMLTQIRDLRERFASQPKATAPAMLGVEDKIIKQAQAELAALRAVRNQSNYAIDGSLYKVDLPDEKIARMLDWDKPLSQQSKQVVKLLKKEHPGWFQEGRYSDKLTAATDLSRNYSGPISDLLQQVDNMQGVMRYGVPAEQMKGNDLWFLTMRNAEKSPDKAATVLRERGIPGIRYLDQGSRGAGQGTSNFVVFPGEEAALTILERNNEIINALRKKKQQ